MRKNQEQGFTIQLLLSGFFTNGLVCVLLSKDNFVQLQNVSALANGQWFSQLRAKSYT